MANHVTGNQNLVNGYENLIKGGQNTVFGDNNKIGSSGNAVQGSGNLILSPSDFPNLKILFGRNNPIINSYGPSSYNSKPTLSNNPYSSYSNGNVNYNLNYL